jgi:hypothetical protein
MTGIKSSNRFFNACLALVSRDFNAEIARRDARRGKNSFQWFTLEEAAVAEALSKIIVPSEQDSPGIDEISILGESAITLLDKIVAESPDRQRFYSHGLLAFDRWALKEQGHRFLELSTDQQTNLFQAAQEKYDHWWAQTSAVAKVQRGLNAIFHAGRGVFHAARLYPMIRGDCLQIFYTSSASWAWLQYDGPPMDEGYCSLTQPRLSKHLYG